MQINVRSLFSNYIIVAGVGKNNRSGLQSPLLLYFA